MCLLYVCFYVFLSNSKSARREQVLERSQLPFEPDNPPFLRFSLLHLTSVSASSQATMHFLQLLPFASLALAVSHPNSYTKRQVSCTSEPWTIRQYHTCTNCTYPGATQETTSLVFDFTDPNFSPPVTATCDLSLLPGSSLIEFDYTPCGSGVAFYYDGADLNVERTGVECGK